MTGLARDDAPASYNPDWYWRCKVQWSKNAQVVLAGNSRVYRGLDPSVFENCLGLHNSVLNAGFSSAVWSRQYLDYLENVLARGNISCIVLGIDPNSLVRPINRPGSPFEDTGFGQALEDTAKTRIPAIWEKRWSSISQRLRPFRMVPPLENKDENYLQRFHSNGWVESDYARPDPDSYIRETRSRMHDLQKIDPVTFGILVERIRVWRSQGIGVVGFRPPTTTQTDLFEDELFQYNEKEVANGVNSAGGCWVELEQKRDYISYDGSHLSPNSARKLSLYLADSIKQCLDINEKVSIMKFFPKTLLGRGEI